MAISELTGQRNVYGGVASTTVTFTFPSTPTQGNLIVCAFAWRQNATVSGVPSGWLLATNTGDGNSMDGAIYYKIAGASEPTSADFTLSASVKASGVASEWSGISASPLDQTDSEFSGATTTVDAGTTATLAQPNELVLCLYASINNVTHTLSDSQVTVGSQIAGGTPDTSLCTTTLGSKVVNATTAIHYTATSSTSQICAGATATFKEASGAASGDLPGHVSHMIASLNPCSCMRVRVYNGRNTAQFIQLHDAASLPADGSIPEISLAVEALSNFDLSYGKKGRKFRNGITICNSTTQETLTLGFNDLMIEEPLIR